MKCSIVIPVYRSSEILPELTRQLTEELKRLELLSVSEIILVNDDSPDDSWSVLKKLSDQLSWIKIINLSRNFGQHNAIMAGLNFASGEYIVLMDDDLQHAPSYIGQLLAALESGADVCFVRFDDRKHAGWKIFGSNVNSMFASYLVEKPRGLYMSSFKAFRKHIRESIVSYQGPYPYLDGLILRSTNRIVTIDAVHHERFSGKGNYNFRKSFSLLLKMATGFSIAPLRLAIFSGVFFGLLSLIMVVYVILEKLADPSVQAGWTSTAAIILAVSGVQMLFLGLLGEYIGRVYLNINKKPQYVIRDVHGFGSRAEEFKDGV